MTKRCPLCGRTLPVSAFYVRRQTPHRLSGHCRECKQLYMRKDKAALEALRYKGYPPEELLCRPKEHVLEQLSATELAPVWGCSLKWAEEVMRHPDLIVEATGEPRLDYQKLKSMYAYVESLV